METESEKPMWAPRILPILFKCDDTVQSTNINLLPHPFSFCLNVINVSHASTILILVKYMIELNTLIP